MSPRARTAVASVAPSHTFGVRFLVGALAVMAGGSLVLQTAVLRAQTTRFTDEVGNMTRLELQDRLQTVFEFGYENGVLTRVLRTTNASGSQQRFVFALDEGIGIFSDTAEKQRQQYAIRVEVNATPQLQKGEVILAQWPESADWTVRRAIVGRLEQALIVQEKQAVWQKFYYTSDGTLASMVRSIANGETITQRMVADLLLNEAVQTFQSGSVLRYRTRLLDSFDALGSTGTVIARWSVSPLSLVPFVLEGKLQAASTPEDAGAAVSYNYVGGTLTQINRLSEAGGVSTRTTVDLVRKEAVVASSNGDFSSYSIIVRNAPFITLPNNYRAIMSWAQPDLSRQYAAGMLKWHIGTDGFVEAYDEAGELIRRFPMTSEE